MKAAAAEMKAKEPEEQPSEPSAMDAAPLRRRRLRADADAPTPPTDAELAAACGNVADALRRRRRDFRSPTRRRRRRASGAPPRRRGGRAAGYRCGATIAAMAAFAKGLGK